LGGACESVGRRQTRAPSVRFHPLVAYLSSIPGNSDADLGRLLQTRRLEPLHWRCQCARRRLTHAEHAGTRLARCDLPGWLVRSGRALRIGVSAPLGRRSGYLDMPATPLRLSEASSMSELLRICERKGPERRVACCLFWTLGAIRSEERLSTAGDPRFNPPSIVVRACGPSMVGVRFVKATGLRPV
jgi:hypothetical protein